MTHTVHHADIASCGRLGGAHPTCRGRISPRRTVEQCAVEAVIWGMPAVNYNLMLLAMVSASRGTFNQIGYWSRPPDWKNETLTPTPIRST